MQYAAELDVTINKEAGLLISFPWGMPGLDYNKFTLTELEQDSPFYFLQSAEKPEVGLVLVNPFVFFKDYEFELDPELVEKLNVSDPQQVAVLCTVNTSKGIKSATINLMAPIVINAERFVAKQVVLNDKRYSLRTPLALCSGAAKGER